MFVDNDNQQEYTLLTPGTHRMKVSSWEVKEDGNWTLTFQKGGFKTNAFGNSPRLHEDGNPESWMKVVGPKGGWLVSTKIFFEAVMGRDEVNQVLKAVDTKIRAKYPTLEEQFAELPRVKGAVKLLIKSLLEAATPYFKTVWFDVDLEERIGLDKEGNEKPYLNVAKKTPENGYKEPYRISEDQTEEEVEPVVEVQDTVNPAATEEVPDWVNEEPKTRTEPSDTEW